MIVKKVAALGLIMLMAVACGDSSTPNPQPDQGVADTGVVPDTGGGTDGSGSDTSTAGECADEQAAAEAQYGGMTIAEIIAANPDCAIDPNPGACLLGRLQTATGGAVQDGCLNCFITSALCTLQNCAAAPANCVTDPTGTDCIACRCAAAGQANTVNCVGAFTQCAGIPSTTTCP